MNNLMFSICVASIFLGAVAFGAPRAETPVDHGHACFVLDSGTILSGTRGGLATHDVAGLRGKVWTAMDGLPGTRTHAVARVGAEIWVGMERGLARFAQSGQGLTHIHSHKTASVRAILTHRGTTYVGTWGRGLFKYNAALKRLERIAFSVRRPDKPRRRISSLTVHDGKLWVGTGGAGIFLLKRGVLRPVYPGLKERLIRSLGSHQGRLWVGSLAGIYSIKGNKLSVEGTADLLKMGLLDGAWMGSTSDGGMLRLAHRRVTSVVIAQSSPITDWQQSGKVGCMSTRSGLWVRQGRRPWSRLKRTGMPGGDIAAMARDGDRLWVGFFDKGLMTFEKGVWNPVGRGIIDRKVNAISVGPKGQVWVGTARALHRIKGGHIQTVTTRDGLPSGDIHALDILPSGAVLVGTARGAALVGQGSIRVLGGKQGLWVNAVWAIAKGPGGKTLIGTAKGLYYRGRWSRWKRLSAASGHLRTDWVTAIAVRGNTVWVGTYNAGVSRLDFTSTGVKATHLGGGWVNLKGITLTSNSILVATMGGLKERRIGTRGAWTHRVRAAPGRDVTAVVEGNNGLWIASRRGLAWRKTTPVISRKRIPFGKRHASVTGLSSK